MWNLRGWVFHHPPRFLQKLGLEVGWERLAARFHGHQGVVCSQASAEYFAKVPLKRSGAPICLPWTVVLSCTRGTAHLVPTGPCLSAPVLRPAHPGSLVGG